MPECIYRVSLPTKNMWGQVSCFLDSRLKHAGMTTFTQSRFLYHTQLKSVIGLIMAVTLNLLVSSLPFRARVVCLTFRRCGGPE